MRSLDVTLKILHFALTTGHAKQDLCVRKACECLDRVHERLVRLRVVDNLTAQYVIETFTHFTLDFLNVAIVAPTQDLHRWSRLVRRKVHGNVALQEGTHLWDIRHDNLRAKFRQSHPEKTTTSTQLENPNSLLTADPPLHVIQQHLTAVPHGESGAGTSGAFPVVLHETQSLITIGADSDAKQLLFLERETRVRANAGTCKRHAWI
mmetsp:Transcript_37637/g.100106  ORF Transcript_37637/g.100106 Transcript_37637/m.100106 type:complete len:207 (-) Transcript_37637:204-824(-)